MSWAAAVPSPWISGWRFEDASAVWVWPAPLRCLPRSRQRPPVNVWIPQLVLLLAASTLLDDQNSGAPHRRSPEGKVYLVNNVKLGEIVRALFICRLADCLSPWEGFHLREDGTGRHRYWRCDEQTNTKTLFLVGLCRNARIRKLWETRSPIVATQGPWPDC
jgi:hypothetical protein